MLISMKKPWRPQVCSGTAAPGSKASNCIANFAQLIMMPLAVPV